MRAEAMLFPRGYFINPLFFFFFFFFAARIKENVFVLEMNDRNELEAFLFCFEDDDEKVAVSPSALVHFFATRCGCFGLMTTFEKRRRKKESLRHTHTHTHNERTRAYNCHIIYMNK